MALSLSWGGAALGQTQTADPDFRPEVARPAYRGEGPIVAIDRAHHNFHTADGRFAPFARLLRADGYRVIDQAAPFSAEGLAGIGVLVIANALGPDEGEARAPAFTDAEADAVRDWVRGGGSLLLVADHAPFGSAAARLGARFGVEMGQGWVIDAGAAPGSVTTNITYSRENGRLGDHPVTRGRDEGERIGTIRAFTGQSLSLPEGASALMTLAPTAREAPDQTALNAAGEAIIAAGGDLDAAGASVPVVGGQVQGLAMRYGAGRIVVLGEAGMLSAQRVTFPDDPQGRRTMRFGMNVAGIDNRQFVLNLLHWLSGALD